MESLARQFEGKASFYILYVREAHPGQNYPAHASFSQKLEYANDLKQLEPVDKRTILIDDLEGTVHQAYGDRPNSVYIVGKDGIISYRADWNDPEQVEEQLNVLLEKDGYGSAVGPVNVADNFVPVLGPTGLIRFPGLASKVLHRAGFAAVADLALMAPNMLQSRIYRWLAKEPAKPAAAPAAKDSQTETRLDEGRHDDPR